jgi:hypothetical protein
MKEVAIRNNDKDRMQQLLPTLFQRALQKASARLRNIRVQKDTATVNTAWVLEAMALVLNVFTMETLASVQQLLASQALDSVLEDSKLVSDWEKLSYLL